MSIVFDCLCGKRLQVADHFASRAVRCPACQTVLEVPDENSPAEELAPQEPRPLKPIRSGHSQSENPHMSRDESDEPPEIYDLDKQEPPQEEKREETWRKRREPKYEPEERRPLVVISNNIIVGMLMMLGAVVWFVVGLMCDLIFFYPPILFLLGVVAFVKGLMGNHD